MRFVWRGSSHCVFGPRLICQRISAARTVSNEFRLAPLDLETLILREQEDLVLKPNDDHGGHGVFLGWETDRQQWREAVKAALQQPYVVQEKVVLEKTRIPTYSD